MAGAGPLPLATLVTPDVRFLFFVNLAAVVLITAFAAAVIVVVLRRRFERSLEEERMVAIGTTTARILHQIKNPVQSLLLQAELLEEFEREGQAESRREAGEAIVGEAMRLASMLNELSSWSSGVKRPHTVAPASIDALIRVIGDAERPVAERAGVRFSLRIGDELSAPVDAYYLRQALENLVRNAREALNDTPDGAVRVELDRENAFARVRVIDNGPGIPADRLYTIFEPFVSTKGSGMGLGLAISREIVERHGGSVEVESREGEGTTFTVRLPLNPSRMNGTAPGTPEAAEERIG